MSSDFGYNALLCIVQPEFCVSVFVMSYLNAAILRDDWGNHNDWKRFT